MVSPFCHPQVSSTDNCTQSSNSVPPSSLLVVVFIGSVENFVINGNLLWFFKFSDCHHLKLCFSLTTSMNCWTFVKQSSFVVWKSLLSGSETWPEGASLFFLFFFCDWQWIIFFFNSNFCFATEKNRLLLYFFIASPPSFLPEVIHRSLNNSTFASPLNFLPPIIVKNSRIVSPFSKCSKPPN